MTSEEHIQKSALKLEASRARAAKQELRHSLAVARLQQMQDRAVERRDRLLGALLVRGAAEDAELGLALARLVDQAKEGPHASLVAGLAGQQPTVRTTTNVVQSALALPNPQTQSTVRS